MGAIEQRTTRRRTAAQKNFEVTTSLDCDLKRPPKNAKFVKLCDNYHTCFTSREAIFQAQASLFDNCARDASKGPAARALVFGARDGQNRERAGAGFRASVYSYDGVLIFVFWIAIPTALGASNAI